MLHRESPSKRRPWRPVLASVALTSGVLAWFMHEPAPPRTAPSREGAPGDFVARGNPRREAKPDSQACSDCDARPVLRTQGARSLREDLKKRANETPLSHLLDERSELSESLTSAWERGVAQCMRARGFDYWLKEDAPDGVADPNAAMLATLPARERIAWDKALLGSDEASAGPARVDVDVSDAVSMAWSSDGCAALAERTLYGDDVSYRNLHMTLSLLRDRAHAQADRDPAYAAALRRYGDCMLARGTEVPASILSGEDSLEDASEGTDAECQRAVGLSELRQRARDQAERALAADNAEELLAFEAMREDALEGVEDP